MKPEKLTPFWSSYSLSGSIISSVLVLFFRVCNTFMNFPSVFPIDASSTVKKKKRLLMIREDWGRQIFESKRENLIPAREGVRETVPPSVSTK
uniref:Uncharacterized protein n=1 Tax=Castor canadensis TaxID=51338 RepID=A0A8C0VWS7_CASCN